MAIQSSLLTVQSNYFQIINGLAAPTTKTRYGINPRDRESLLPVPVATEQDLDDAVAAGKAAFESWSTTPYEQRKAALLSYADALESYKQDFQDLLALETGKIEFEATAELQVSLDWLRGLADIPLPEDTVMDTETRTIITRHVPIGVVSALVPWNSPVMLASVKIALAVLTGNVIIIKPSPYTPYADLKLVELAQSYFPPGVIQSLSGDDRLGPWMSAHPGIDMISLTGSINSGKKAMESASKNLKRFTLELGGNDPAIIFPDVDINQVAQKIAALAFVTSGQICVAIKRIYVHASIYTAFRAALVEAVQKLTIGPVQNAMQFDHVKTYFEDIKNHNWTVAVGGTIEQSPGYFIPPTIIDSPPEDSRIVVEEPFGPIVPLLVWDDEQDVIMRANNSDTGLGASIWTKNLEKANEIARKIQAGNVWINDHCNFAPVAPFGGHKQSGIGSEGGLHGLKHHCNIQVLNFNKA